MKRNKKIRRAILLMACSFFLLTGCGSREEEKQEEPEPVVNFKAIVMGTRPQDGLDELYAALDALTVPELNCTLRFEFIPWGNERKQLNIATASGEYDFIPGGIFSDYRVLVAKNAFLDLKKYLYLAPELTEHYAYYNKSFLEDCEINGGLYGINQFGPGSLQYENEGFFYREDLRRKWGLPEITDLESMEDYLYRAKQEEAYKNESLITDNRIWQSLWILLAEGKYLEVSSMQETPFVVVRAEEPEVVLNRLETPEFKEVLQYIRKWRRDGILEPNMLSLSDNEGERGLRLIAQDLKPCETNAPIWSVSASFLPVLTQNHPEWEYGFFSYIQDNGKLYADSGTGGSVISISSKTKYPETAVKLLAKIHTDKRYYDLICYGVEGIHYQLQGGKVSYEGIPNANKFGMTVARDTLLNYDEVQANEQWGKVLEKYDAWRDVAVRTAQKNPIENLTLHTGGLEKVLEEMEAVRLRYFQPLVCGYYGTDDKRKETIELLEHAGLERYRDSVQKQLRERLKQEENKNQALNR